MSPKPDPRTAGRLSPELQRTLIEGVLQEAGTRSVEQLAQEENELLVGLLHLRAR